ncbi:MAG TPA: hypothetical protein VGK20_00685 [Candidatus Binatia bacterium]|jgi:hypothetical protein
MWQFEHHSMPLLPWRLFLRRLATSAAVGFGMIVASLAVGMAGYHFFEGLGAVDSFTNAAMILSGMGPLLQPQSTGGKIFAGLYALYSGLAVLVIAGVAFAPLIHRFLHRMHAVDAGEQDEPAPIRGQNRPPL